MPADLFHLSLSPGDLVVRAAIVYIFVLVLLRFNGKRQLGQMSAIEFVAILLISNAVQNSMNGGDNSLGGGMILAVALIGFSRLISFATYRNRRLRDFVQGTPTLLIHNGEVIAKAIARERLTQNDLKTLLRKQGVHHFHEVHAAILEVDGSLTLTRKIDVVPGAGAPPAPPPA